MTDQLTDRIAEVLREHALSREDRRAWWCTCGADCLNTEGSYWNHADKAVVAGCLPSRSHSRRCAKQ